MGVTEHMASAGSLASRKCTQTQVLPTLKHSLKVHIYIHTRICTWHTNIKNKGKNTWGTVGNVRFQTFAAGDDRDSPWLAPHAEDDRSLDPGNEEVGSLPHHLREDAAEPVKYHRPLSSVHCEGGRGGRGGREGREGGWGKGMMKRSRESTG